MFESVCEPTVEGVQAADPFALAAALATVTQDTLVRCSAEQAELVIAATQRVINAMSARQQLAVDRYTDHVVTARYAEDSARNRAPMPGAPTPDQESAACLAPILRLAPRTVVMRIGSARWLGLLPRTDAMAWAGDLEPHRVTAITRAAVQVGIEQLAEFEARLHHHDLRDLPGSRVATRAQRIAARLVAAAAPGEPSDVTAAVARDVRVCADDHPGLTRWQASLPADSSRLMWAAVERLAQQYRGANPDLSVAQSRADALTDLVLTDVQVTTTATIVLPAATAIVPTTSERGTTPEQTTTRERSTLDTYAADGPGIPAAVPPVAVPPVAVPPVAVPPVAVPPVAVPPVTPPPFCQCGGRLASWVDVVHPRPRHPVQLDTATDTHTVIDPDADADADIDAEDQSLLHGQLLSTLQDWADTIANPHLTQDARGQIWFVPGVVTVPPVGTLLPTHVAAILADPDVRIQLGTANAVTGAVEHLGERTYRPGAALARLVRARDGTCRFPGCATAAERCDLDHVTPFPAGATTAANLQSLCRTHHGFKHHASWSVTMTPDGTCTWTAPNGRTHTTRPAAIHDEAA